MGRCRSTPVKRNNYSTTRFKKNFETLKLSVLIRVAGSLNQIMKHLQYLLLNLPNKSSDPENSHPKNQVPHIQPPTSPSPSVPITIIHHSRNLSIPPRSIKLVPWQSASQIRITRNHHRNPVLRSEITVFAFRGGAPGAALLVRETGSSAGVSYYSCIAEIVSLSTRKSGNRALCAKCA